MSQFAIDPSLKDTVAYVTGGASGIGGHIVRVFSEQRSRVGFVDMDAESGDVLAGIWGERGDHRIRVNIIVSGWVMTDRQKEKWSGVCVPFSVSPGTENPLLSNVSRSS